MKKVKHILSIFIQSFIPQDRYYPKLLHTRLLFSLRYYVVILFCFTGIFMGILLFCYSPNTIVRYKDSILHTLSSFPDETKITVHNGVLELNQNRPLFLWVYDKNQPLFVFMVYTKDTLDTSHIPLPLVFLGRDHIQITYKNYTKTIRYGLSHNLTFTKGSVQLLIAQAQSLFPSFMGAFYLFLLIVLPMVFMGAATVLIILSSFITYMLLRPFISHIHIKKCIQAGMHGTHIPLFLTLILYALFPTSHTVFIVSAALIFVFTLVSTYEMYSKEL